MVNKRRKLESKKNSISSLLGFGLIFLLTLSLIFKTSTLKVGNEANPNLHSKTSNHNNFQIIPLAEIENQNLFTSENEEESEDDETSFEETIGFFQFLLHNSNNNQDSIFYNLAVHKTTPLFLLFGQLKVYFS